MKKIPYKIRILIAVLCFVTAVEGLCAAGYLISIKAPVASLVGVYLTVLVCIISGIIFVPTHKPDGTTIVNEKKPRQKPKPRPMVYSKPSSVYDEEPLNEEDEEEEEEDEILAMEMLDDVLDD